ncbi:unnamed protein product [Owenia fusiformis]|uniref:Uncharacterized protein n=1 Tax=Owenia fusiformis TaxID=6347 RepID=A0A8J1TQT3_OWEFU|nr:unnamed protein product [Owenia fusiformis]
MAEATYSAEQVGQLLQCPVCLDRFNNPKILPCQHTFCVSPCLEGLVNQSSRSLKCPECRKEHKLPYAGISGFPNNLTISRFLDLPAQSREPPEENRNLSQNQCRVCENEADLSKCVHCDKMVCSSCKESHVSEMRLEIGRLVNQIRNGLPKVSESISTVENKQEQLKQMCEGVKSEINNSVERHIRDLKQRQKLLQSELDTFLTGEQRSLRLHQESLEVQLASISSSCDSIETKLNTSNNTIQDSALIAFKNQCNESMEQIKKLDQNSAPQPKPVHFKANDSPLQSCISNFGEVTWVTPSSNTRSNDQVQRILPLDTVESNTFGNNMNNIFRSEESLVPNNARSRNTIPPTRRLDYMFNASEFDSRGIGGTLPAPRQSHPPSRANQTIGGGNGPRRRDDRYRDNFIHQNQSSIFGGYDPFAPSLDNPFGNETHNRITTSWDSPLGGTGSRRNNQNNQDSGYISSWNAGAGATTPTPRHTNQSSNNTRQTHLPNPRQSDISPRTNVATQRRIAAAQAAQRRSENQQVQNNTTRNEAVNRTRNQHASLNPNIQNRNPASNASSTTNSNRNEGVPSIADNRNALANTTTNVTNNRNTINNSSNATNTFGNSPGYRLGTRSENTSQSSTNQSSNSAPPPTHNDIENQTLPVRNQNSGSSTSAPTMVRSGTFVRDEGPSNSNSNNMPRVTDQGMSFEVNLGTSAGATNQPRRNRGPRGVAFNVGL